MGAELPQNVGSRLGDLRDLPEDLVRQIPAARVDELEQEIIDLIKEDFEGAAAVDEILVQLYRRTGTIHDRKKLSSKLYRMVTSSPPLLASVEKRRGVYRVV